MKWKFSEYEKPPELSSDIEWMLQSGQVSRTYFLEALTETYYPSLLHLATTLLDDKDAARNATRKIFLKAILNVHHYRSQMGVQTWLFRIAYSIILRSELEESLWRWLEKKFSSLGELTNPASSEPESSQDAALWRALDELKDSQRNILIMQYANGFSQEQISAITGLNLVQVMDLHDQAVLEISQSGITVDGDLKKVFSSSFERRWPRPQYTPEEIHTYAQSLEGNAGRGHSVQRGMTTMKEVAIIGLAILIVFLMIWGGNRFFLRDEDRPAREGSSLSGGQSLPTQAGATSQNRSSAMSTSAPGLSGGNQSLSQQPVITPTPSGVFYYVQEGDTLAEIASKFGVTPYEMAVFNRIPEGAVLAPGLALVIPGSLPEGRQLQATPVSTAVRIDPNTRPQTSQDILQILNPDALPYNTLWIDASVSSRRPGDPNFRDTISRFQVWLSQRQFLIIGGPVGDEPAEVGIGLGGRFYVAEPGEGKPFFEDRTTHLDKPPMSVPLFFGMLMLFGDSNEVASSQFAVLGESKVADREVWVVSQSSKEGNPQALLWLDKETGLSLHVERLDSPEFLKNVGEFRPDELTVRSVAYDVDFPQELFNNRLPWRGGYAANYTGMPASLRELSRPFSIDALVPEKDKSAPPENFDPGHSQLSFTYPVGSAPLPHLAGTDVYADGYYLGQVKLGVPWYASCRRSDDGEKVVFQVGSQGRADPTNRTGGFYYTDLKSVDKVYRLQPAEPGADQDFAISPDSRTVAVWGCSGRDDACGVYLHDMDTHKWRLLAPSEEGASSFTWSPDGKSLAWMNAGDVLIVMDVRTGKITYTSEYEAFTQAPTVRSPLESWGVSFPPPIMGLEGCTFPPSE